MGSPQKGPQAEAGRAPQKASCLSCWSSCLFSLCGFWTGWPGAKAALPSGRSGPGAGERGVRGGRSTDPVGRGTVLKYYCFKVLVYSVFTVSLLKDKSQTPCAGRNCEGDWTLVTGAFSDAHQLDSGWGMHKKAQQGPRGERQEPDSPAGQHAGCFTFCILQNSLRSSGGIKHFIPLSNTAQQTAKHPSKVTPDLCRVRLARVGTKSTSALNGVRWLRSDSRGGGRIQPTSAWLQNPLHQRLLTFLLPSSLCQAQRSRVKIVCHCYT